MRKIFFILIGILIPVAVVLFLSNVLAADSIAVNSFSKDIICAGTIQNPCIAEINFTAKEDMNLSLSEINTNLFKTNEKTIGMETYINGIKYDPSSYLEAVGGKTYEIKFIVLKNETNQTINWEFEGSSSKWIGINKTVKGYQVNITAMNGSDVLNIKLINYSPECYFAKCYALYLINNSMDISTFDKSKSYSLRGELLNKNNVYEIWDSNAPYEINITKKVCSLKMDEFTKKEEIFCENIVIGTETKYGAYIPYNLKTLPLGESLIREKIDIKPGEMLDVVPQFLGYDIEEWVLFTGMDKIEFYETGQDNAGWISNDATDQYCQFFTIGTTGINQSYRVEGAGLYLSDVYGTGSVNIGVVVYKANATNDGCSSTAISVRDYFTLTLPTTSFMFYNITFDTNGTMVAGQSGCLCANSTDRPAGAGGIFWGNDRTAPSYSGGYEILSGGVSGIPSKIDTGKDLLFQVWGEQKGVIGNFTFDNITNLGIDSGMGFGNLAYSGWSSISTGCISNNCSQTNGGSGSNTYNNMTTVGGWSMWFRPATSTSLVTDLHCLVIHDKGGNNKGDFAIGLSGGASSTCDGVTTAYPQGVIIFYFNNVSGVQSIRTTNTFTGGQWYHLFFKLNSSMIGIYVNGELNASGYGSVNQAMYGSGTTSYFIQGSGDGGNYTIDEAKFYNIEMSDSDILALYNSEKPSATNTCTPPSAGSNWEVVWSDNCSINSNTNIGAGNFTLNGTSGAGFFYLNATLTAHNVQMIPKTGTALKFSILSGGKLIRI